MSFSRPVSSDLDPFDPKHIPDLALNLVVDYHFDPSNRCFRREYDMKFNSCDPNRCPLDITLKGQNVPDTIGKKSSTSFTRGRSWSEAEKDPWFRKRLGSDFNSVTQWVLNHYTHPPGERCSQGGFTGSCRVTGCQHSVALMGGVDSFVGQPNLGDIILIPVSDRRSMTDTPLSQRRYEVRTSNGEGHLCSQGDEGLSAWIARCTWTSIIGNESCSRTSEENNREGDRGSSVCNEGPPGSYTKFCRNPGLVDDSNTGTIVDETWGDSPSTPQGDYPTADNFIVVGEDYERARLLGWDMDQFN